MRLLLIRHGETTENVRGAISTIAPGPELTEAGRQQSAAIPAALGREPIDGIYASQLRRTSATALPLSEARELPIQVVDGIQEITGGVWEHRTDPEALRGYIGTLGAWWHDRSVAIAGGESGRDFFGRFDAAIARIYSAHRPDDTVAIFSHGAALRVWASGTALDEESARGLRLHNTGMITLEGAPEDGWTILEWHMDPIGGVALHAHPDPTGDAPLDD